MPQAGGPLARAKRRVAASENDHLGIAARLIKTVYCTNDPTVSGCAPIVPIACLSDINDPALKKDSDFSGMPKQSPGDSSFYRVLAPAFFASAQRAFASADNFFRAAGLISFRGLTFFAGDEVVVGVDLPFCFAHRAFCAVEILARADALIVRLPVEDFGGRPRRGLDPFSAAMASSIRFRSAVSSATI